jgi:DNA-binding NtrC family response regulator
MKPSIWVVSARPRLGEIFAPAAGEYEWDFVPGLLPLMRREGAPTIIAVDGSEHELRMADAALKIQLNFPGALLLALLEDTRVAETANLREAGVDEVSSPVEDWLSDIRRLVRETADLNRLGWVGKSNSLRHVAAQALQAAPADIAVLVTGESGVGKELVARALHDFSPRARAPFLPVNTGAIPETLLESELFGHEKGAFTGAASRHRGIFEAAQGGTVFLDEIGDMPPATQVKLLRVLESHRFRRVGGTVELDADVRVVSATHRDLVVLEEGGTFRRDLYYRLSAITLRMAALRERRADILPLLFHFWREQATGPGPPAGVEPAAAQRLWRYHWPGNVRELRNFAAAAAVAVAGDRVTEEHVLQYVQGQRGQDRNLPVPTRIESGTGGQEMVLHAILHLGHEVRELRRLIEERLPESCAEEPVEIRPPAASIADAERRAIEAALLETGGRRREAARRLGIGERTLYRKIKEYGLK